MSEPAMRFRTFTVAPLVKQNGNLSGTQPYDSCPACGARNISPYKSEDYCRGLRHRLNG